MTTTETTIRNILVKVLRLDPDALPSTLDVDSIESWDSLGHMNLLLEIQAAFRIDIPHADAVNLQSEADLVAAVQRLTATK